MFDEVAIDDAQTANAGAAQRFSVRGTEGAATNNQHSHREEFALSVFSNAVE